MSAPARNTEAPDVDPRGTAGERIQTPYLAAEDEFEITLRPRRLDEFVGQTQLKEQLAVAIEASNCLLYTSRCV